MTTNQKLWELFKTTFAISATTSGGWAIVAAMRTKFVEKFGWLDENEVVDLVSIAQSSPGPIAVNASVLVGYTVAGMPGAIVTMLGTVLPALIIMSLVTVFYTAVASNVYLRFAMRGMQAAVAAVLIDVFLGLFSNLRKQNDWFFYIVAIVAFILIRYVKLNLAIVAFASAFAGIVKTVLLTKKVQVK